MINIPVMNDVDNLNNNIDDTPQDDIVSYDYGDNLTAKLGGKYAKIIEYYENRL
ncbi:hypothetical protein NBE98_10170 [Clostridium swellfunianum]|uniref:hypothetical protein n=1 Tax=Clostridium swellfunianum TaxID=1367462 RepID=UPI00202DDAF3|nr:hypothetical protein [Clostridium swellfunianum]MCM0648740.1 hypothetical protein [Clostridium swellfunianum]